MRNVSLVNRTSLLDPFSPFPSWEGRGITGFSAAIRVLDAWVHRHIFLNLAGGY